MLRAIHCPLSYAIGTLRLSVGRYTTKQDVEEAAEIIIAAVYKLLEQPSVNQKLAWELYNVDPGTDFSALFIAESIYRVPKVAAVNRNIELDPCVCRGWRTALLPRRSGKSETRMIFLVCLLKSSN